MKIFSKADIEKCLSTPDVLTALKEGFIAYSQGKTNVPPPALLHFDSPPGECHIKYGYETAGRYYVVKIASGFFENPKLGLPSGNGLILLFDKNTGRPASLFLDEGYLTDVRTAAAGCLAAKALAPKNVSSIGIVGTGGQAYYQLKFLSSATSCSKALIWGRDSKKAAALAKHPDFKDWTIEVAQDLNQLAAKCNLIVTTTASTTPLLFAHHIRPGTHITAMGADDINKQELDEALFAKADKVIVDSRSQCMRVGDVKAALKKNLIQPEKLTELGEILHDPSLGRTSSNQITLCCLTGIAIQDLKIAESAFKSASSQ